MDGNRLRHIGDGVIATDSADPVPERLKILHDALMALLERLRPDEAAVEETYVNRNGAATLKLGYARGVALLAPALAGVPVTEYGAKSVKKAVVGTGGADKDQVEMMVRRLLPGALIRRADAADALAVAICHAHNRASKVAWGARRAVAGGATVVSYRPAGAGVWLGIALPGDQRDLYRRPDRRRALSSHAARHNAVAASANPTSRPAFSRAASPEVLD